MSKQVKAMVTEALRARFDGVREACVVDVTGLDVASTLQVRRTLLSKNMRMVVVKNSLARRAFEGGPLAPIGNGLRGPCALVTGGDSAIEVAREMVNLAKGFPKIKLKIGMLVGDEELRPVAEMAQRKGYRELMGELPMLLSSPGRAIAGCLLSAQSKVAGCLKAMADKQD